MEVFRIGDFVRLKDLNNSESDYYINKDVNTFEIKSIDNEIIALHGYKQKVSLKEIEPIPINGKDANSIYYDPIVCASCVGPNDPVPIHRTDYTYFFETFKRCFYMGKNYQEIINDLGLKYVHEVQHFLKSNKDEGLKINAL